jgi:HEPN domain-containing protein
MEKNREEAGRWLDTGRSDLETAKILLESRRFAHACFHAQQAGEKALKALWYSRDVDPWGHSIRKLIEDLAEVNSTWRDEFSSFINDGTKLDRFYIPTRYPNGLPGITPEMAYFEEDAREAIEIAGRILEHIDKRIEEESEATPDGNQTVRP